MVFDTPTDEHEHCYITTFKPTQFVIASFSSECALDLMYPERLLHLSGKMWFLMSNGETVQRESAFSPL